MTQYWRKYDHATYFKPYIDILHDIKYLIETANMDKASISDTRVAFLNAGDDFDEWETIIKCWMKDAPMDTIYEKIARRMLMADALGQCMDAAFCQGDDDD
jgi:hypothetical protein